MDRDITCLVDAAYLEQPDVGARVGEWFVFEHSRVDCGCHWRETTGRTMLAGWAVVKFNEVISFLIRVHASVDL